MPSRLSRTLIAISGLFFFASLSLAQPASRGSIAIWPVITDDSGTPTSRAKAKEALTEVVRKGGFRVLDDAKASQAWRSLSYRTPTIVRPPSKAQLSQFAKVAGVRYVLTSSVTFHTRSIWVNLGPKTVASCHVAVTVLDSQTGKIVHEADADGRSDEKSDGLKVAGALLISPLVTAVSGGPRTPQESRAAQIAVARALEKLVVVSEKQ